jgi:hypothetical protein
MARSGGGHGEREGDACEFHREALFPLLLAPDTGAVV